MSNEVLNRRYYLSEFKLDDGEKEITFNIVGINTAKNEITVAITDEGKISVRSFDLQDDCGQLFFEYGRTFEKIAVDNFEQPEEE